MVTMMMTAMKTNRADKLAAARKKLKKYQKKKEEEDSAFLKMDPDEGLQQFGSAGVNGNGNVNYNNHFLDSDPASAHIHQQQSSARTSLSSTASGGVHLPTGLMVEHAIDEASYALSTSGEHEEDIGRDTAAAAAHTVISQRSSSSANSSSLLEQQKEQLCSLQQNESNIAGDHGVKEDYYFPTLATQSATKLAAANSTNPNGGEKDPVAMSVGSSTHSSTEQLKMLTQKLNELVSTSVKEAGVAADGGFGNNSARVGEEGGIASINEEKLTTSLDLVDMYKKRSIDLTQKIDLKNQEIEKLCREIGKLKSANQQMLNEKVVLEGRFENFRMEMENGHSRSLEALNQEKDMLGKQMNSYSHTVDILVAEKSELQRKLDETKAELDRQSVDNNGLKVALQREQAKLGDLQAQHQTVLNGMTQTSDVSRVLEQERNSLQGNIQALGVKVEELSNHNNELQMKLQVQLRDTEKLKESKAALEAQIEKFQSGRKASVGDTVGSFTLRELEGLKSEKETLEERLREFNTSIDILTAEKIETDKQWRLDSETIKGLQENLREKNKEISQLQDENNVLVHQNTTLSFSVEELKKAKAELQASIAELQQQYQQARRASSVASAHSGVAAGNESVTASSREEQSEHEAYQREAIERLEKELRSCKEELELYVKTSGEMKALIMKQAEEVASLESQVARSREEENQRSQLLEKMRSDAETISRATMQNKQLKEQLIELQDQVADLTKENALLSSKASENLFESDEKGQSEELAVFAERIKELEQMVTELNHYKQVVESGNSSVDSNVIETLTEQLKAKTSELESHSGTNALLTQELNVLRGKLQEASKEIEVYKGKVEAFENITVSEAVESIGDATNQPDFVREKEMLLERIAELEKANVELESAKEVGQSVSVDAIPVEGKQDTGASAMKEDVNTKELQDRIETLEDEKNSLKQDFLILKDEFEEISDQKRDLIRRLGEEEKINAQLSLESETIGEYISLYQSQRLAIKQKLEEKEVFIEGIKHENERLVARLKELEDVAFEIYHEKKDLEKRMSVVGEVYEEVDLNGRAENQMDSSVAEEGSPKLPKKVQGTRLPERMIVSNEIEFPPCKNCSYEILRV
eukprot:Nk52_evm39s2612 gene=Nk52_evmTU39s2612